MSQTATLSECEVKQYLEDHGPVWELYDPRLGQCSVCCKKLDKGTKPILEVRPSGIAGRAQLWPYCPDCAIKYKGKRLSEEGLPRSVGYYDGNSSIPNENGRYHATGSVCDISGAWLLPSLDEIFDFKNSQFGAKQQ